MERVTEASPVLVTFVSWLEQNPGSMAALTVKKLSECGGCGTRYLQG
jgi:hypothetical protein